MHRNRTHDPFDVSLHNFHGDQLGSKTPQIAWLSFGGTSTPGFSVAETLIDFQNPTAHFLNHFGSGDNFACVSNAAADGTYGTTLAVCGLIRGTGVKVHDRVSPMDSLIRALRSRVSHDCRERPLCVAPRIARPHPMTREIPCRETTFGYLSALESAEHGFFGGYLLISRSGRPLEFHCTTPVRPNRAQQILYGPTLRPYLLGEQIGGSLVREAAITPQLILTDQSAILSLRSQIDVPVVFVIETSDAEHASTEAAIGTAVEDRQFCLCDNSCVLASGFEAEQGLVVKLLTELAQRVDLIEPFDRIHGAIREAQRIGGEGPETHGQAA